MTSYYDSLGLLAICDAIESVEGVPLSALPPADSDKARARQRTWSTPAKQQGAPLGNGTAAPPNLKTPNYTHTAHPNGTTPAAANHDGSISSPASAAAHAPGETQPYAYPPESASNNKLRKMSLPLLPPHNLQTPHDDQVAADGTRSYPLLYAQSITYPRAAAAAAAAAGKTGGDDVKADGTFSHLSAQLATTGKQYAVTKARRDSRGRKLSTAMVDMPGMVLDMKMSHMSLKHAVTTAGSPGAVAATAAGAMPPPPTTPNHKTAAPSQVAFATSPVAIPGGAAGADPAAVGGTPPRPPLMVGGFKVEECHICGRSFKGPKASTHKQQHIRRLHPEDYTPKRGGKKRVVIIDSATVASATATAAAAIGATTGGVGGGGVAASPPGANNVSLSTSSPH